MKCKNSVESSLSWWVFVRRVVVRLDAHQTEDVVYVGCVEEEEEEEEEKEEEEEASTNVFEEEKLPGASPIPTSRTRRAGCQHDVQQCMMRGAIPSNCPVRRLRKSGTVCSTRR